MKPLIKWPGGKATEISRIENMIPEYERYIEPFFGGGALFFHLKPERAVINDISEDLIEYYRLIRNQDTELHDLLLCYNNSFMNLISVCEENYSDILGLFTQFDQNEITRSELEISILDLTSGIARYINSGFSESLVLNGQEFISQINKAVSNKIRRTVANNRKQPYSEDDLKSNLITGFTGGYYTYFRDVFNSISLGRISNPSAQYKTANFYFIREYCYGSMFRYNKNGGFNIPYGGMSYNKKDFLGKIENMFNTEVENIFRNTEIHSLDFEEFFRQINLNDRDFMFLDPPYDTDFSDYAGKKFTRADQERLANALIGTPATFILIIKNTEFIHGLYENDFNVIPFDKQYTYNVRSRNDRNVEHLIITNLPGL